MSIAQAREEWQHVIGHGGGVCPVCDRSGVIYTCGLNYTKARSLIWLCAASTSERSWVMVPQTAPREVVRSNQLPSLHWWGLVESSGLRTGLWRPTELGFAFLNREVKLPTALFIYNNAVQGYSNKNISIAECFKDTFEYQDAMNFYSQGTP
jgi:hypothetical protein